MKFFLQLFFIGHAVCCFAGNNTLCWQLETKSSSLLTDSASFAQSAISIQSSYNSMYKKLPQDLKNRVQCAASSMECIRSKSTSQARSILASQRKRAENSMNTAVSQLSVSDAVKAQVDVSRHEIVQRIEEMASELRARRALHR